MSWPLCLAFGWHLLGGATTLVAFGLWFVGVPIAWAWVVPTLALGGLVGVFLRWRPKTGEPGPRLAWITRIALVVAAVAVLVTAATTLAPDWDGMAIWGIKAKLLTIGELDADWLDDPLNRRAHPEYPLHVPLRGALIAVIAGWSGAVLPVLLAVDVIMIALLFVGTLEAGRGHRSASWLLVGLLAVPALWNEVPRGYADPAVALAFTATLAALCRWLRCGHREWLVVAALSSGVGVWTKQEGLVLLLVAFGGAWLLAPFAERHRWPLVAAGTVGVAWVGPWQLVRSSLGVETEPFGWRGVDQLERVPTILNHVVADMARIASWSLLWPAAAVAVAWLGWGSWRDRSIDAARWLPGVALMFGLSAWCTVYIASPHDVVWHLETSLHRLLLQLAPAAMMVILAAFDRPETPDELAAK